MTYTGMRGTGKSFVVVACALATLTACGGSLRLNTSRPEVASVRLAPRQTRIAIIPIEDARKIRDRVGELRDGFGFEEGPLTADATLLEWLEDSLVETFAEAGQRVRLVPRADVGGDVVVAVRVEQLLGERKVTESAHYGAKVVFDVTVELPNGQRFARVFSGQTEIPHKPFSFPAKLLEEALRTATREAVGKVARHVNVLCAEQGVP